MPLPSPEVAHLVGATIAGIAPLAFASLSPMQISFAFLTFLGPVPSDFTAVPAFSMELTVAFDRKRCTSFSSCALYYHFG